LATNYTNEKKLTGRPASPRAGLRNATRFTMSGQPGPTRLIRAKTGRAKTGRAGPF